MRGVRRINPTREVLPALLGHAVLDHHVLGSVHQVQVLMDRPQQLAHLGGLASGRAHWRSGDAFAAAGQHNTEYQHPEGDMATEPNRTSRF
jgi:hypothetical protein